MIYVAGSGPSGKGHRKAHVVTKKKVHWDYEHIVVPRGHWLTQETRDKAIVWIDYERRNYWEDYYSKFCNAKPSNGLQAVFCAIDLYDPKEITLIGFDYILDSAKPTQHKWPTELECIQSLVKIIDPRTDS